MVARRQTRWGGQVRSRRPDLLLDGRKKEVDLLDRLGEARHALLGQDLEKLVRAFWAGPTDVMVSACAAAAAAAAARDEESAWCGPKGDQDAQAATDH